MVLMSIKVSFALHKRHTWSILPSPNLHQSDDLSNLSIADDSEELEEESVGETRVEEETHIKVKHII